jgi:thiol-disulfide isomerase/thioredoxin
MALYVLNAGNINTVFAAQQNTKEVLQKGPGEIYGEVTDVITAAGFTYIEIDSGKEKVWAAGPVTALKKGDMVAFSTDMPMHDFHSKSIARDFSLIYFVNRYITDKETPATALPQGHIKQPQTNKPGTMSITTTTGGLGIGDYLREVTLDGLNTKSKKLSDFRGKPLIINIWTSWCGPCRSEMGSLERLAQRYNGNEFNIIGVSTDDYRNKATAFIRQTEITFENFLDTRLLVENMLGANTIPLTVFIDADGRILRKVRGPREWDSPKIIDAIAKVFHVRLADNNKPQ